MLREALCSLEAKRLGERSGLVESELDEGRIDPHTPSLTR